MLPACLFHLQIFEEALADGIVVRVALCGERLKHVALIQQAPELFCSEWLYERHRCKLVVVEQLQNRKKHRISPFIDYRME